MIYALGLLVSTWEGWHRSFVLGLTILIALLISRVIDVLVTGRRQRRRPSGWDTYFDD